jgi:hypothetical protein
VIFWIEFGVSLLRGGNFFVLLGKTLWFYKIFFDLIFWSRNNELIFLEKKNWFICMKKMHWFFLWRKTNCFFGEGQKVWFYRKIVLIFGVENFLNYRSSNPINCWILRKKLARQIW